MTLPFIDLAAQQARIRNQLDSAIARVLEHGRYIMGPEVGEFEEKLAAFCGAKHALGCANGTDALSLALMALGVKTGDAVFVPSFTFAATAEVVPFLGATPVFVDVLPDTFNIDVESLYKAMGADLASSDNEAISHMAGIIDGITLATTKIRAHGLDNWTKG